LHDSRLEAEKIVVSYTPRRLVLIANNVLAEQSSPVINKTGPSKRAALKDDGTPTPALDGFLRSNNAKLEDVTFEDFGKGEVALIKKQLIGLPTEQILPGWIETVIKSIPFPKKMKWGSGEFDFARPVRWLVCLWGEDVLSVNIEGLTAGRISFGNRFIGLDTSVEISNPQEYFNSLKTINVIADRQQRYEMIQQQLQNIFPHQDFAVDMDEALLQTVTDLVEFPTAVIAEFESKFLVLPEKIVTSTISTNQKYFAVQDNQGNLTNKFIFVSNGKPQFNELIRKGNEKVVKPRLEDAMWYYQEDTKQPLEDYVPHLENVVFQAELGTLKDKTNRIVDLSAFLSKLLKLSEQDDKAVQRTALLCKADLVTKMLGEKEFTKLQGYVGMHYALASDEQEAVAKGIYEHYMPRGQNDELPQTLNGAIVAVSDKIDTVCGIIGIGMLPTGSADPFALRRAANGIVQIIAERGWDIDLTELINVSLSLYNRNYINSDKNRDIIRNYFHQRINWYLQQLKIDYDVIDSVMHIDFGNLLHLIQRAKALQNFKLNEDFVKLVIGFKRVSNIIKDEKNQLVIQEKLLKEPAEISLFNAIQNLEDQIEADLSRLNYKQVLNHLVGIRTAIDLFFDDVLVNIEDEQLRLNRYALLQEIRKAFLKVADLSILVVEGKTGQ